MGALCAGGTRLARVRGAPRKGQSPTVLTYHKAGIIMSNFFHNFLDELPVFLCVVNAETKTPIYFNKLAAECLGNMTYENRVEFIREIIRLDSSLKYCENTRDTERGRWYRMETHLCEWLDEQKSILILGTDHSTVVSNEEDWVVAAYTDHLTGLYNRQIGLEMLAKFVNELKHGSPPFTMSFVDIDDLKYVNDNFGHSAGDKYILTVVDLIKKSIRQSDIFARMGGDEFLLIFPKCTAEVIESILSEVSKTLKIINEDNEPRTYYSISYGILEVNPEDDIDMEVLLATAGDNMYNMKREYKKTRILPA